MGLDLTPLDALQWDLGVIAADDRRRGRNGKRIASGAKKSAEAVTAGMLYALYTEG